MTITRKIEQNLELIAVKVINPRGEDEILEDDEAREILATCDDNGIYVTEKHPVKGKVLTVIYGSDIRNGLPDREISFGDYVYEGKSETLSEKTTTTYEAG